MDNMETDERGPCPSGGGVRPFVQSVKQSGPHRYTPARAAAFQLLWTYIVGVVGRLWHNERGYDIGQQARAPAEAQQHERQPYDGWVYAEIFRDAAAHAAYLADADRAREEAYHAKRHGEQDVRTLSEGLAALQFFESPKARSRMLKHWRDYSASARPMAARVTNPDEMRTTANRLLAFADEWENEGIPNVWPYQRTLWGPDPR